MFYQVTLLYLGFFLLKNVPASIKVSIIHKCTIMRIYVSFFLFIPMLLVVKEPRYAGKNYTINRRLMTYYCDQKAERLY